MNTIVMEMANPRDTLKNRAIDAKVEVFHAFADIPMEINTPDKLKDYVREAASGMSDDCVDAIRLSKFVKDHLGSGAWCYQIQICGTQDLKAKLENRSARRGVKVHIAA